MAYTRAWDETFPPDTQQANLLGQDVRNTKVDLRERISSWGSGTLAARPTPDATFVGVSYFAYDTGQYFRWNGSSWDDLSASWIVSQLATPGAAVGVGTTSPTTGQVLTATGATAATWQTPASPATVRQIVSQTFLMVTAGVASFTGDITCLRAPVGGFTITKISGYNGGAASGNSYINVRHNGATDLLLSNLALPHTGGWISTTPDQSAAFAEGDEVQFCLRGNDQPVNYVTIQVDIQY